MESIYHHTSFNVLKSIVTDTGLNFRASKYSNYINGETTGSGLWFARRLWPE